jgi:hypothetical protein
VGDRGPLGGGLPADQSLSWCVACERGEQRKARRAGRRDECDDERCQGETGGEWPPRL